jgi:antitoxin component HigA of HigAB toxin-antitoxin module
MQLKQVDLAEALGGKNRVFEVLNRKRKLTLDMIRTRPDSYQEAKFTPCIALFALVELSS